MNPAEVAQRLGDRLEEAGLPYAIGGALALGAWGAPRVTKDVDLSIFAPVSKFSTVADALERAGMIFDRARAPKDLERIGLFNGRLAGVVVDLFMSGHPHMAEMQRRRQRIEAPDGSHLYFISAEDLCVMKLLYGRPKDVGDLERLLAARPDLDLAYVRRWLLAMPLSDKRLPILDDLERRFANR
ncbi:MAG TPA: hypothetical protein VFO79_15710 [Xanthomonadales bacterium]|nr:hypothetical protein [Xanthomonadales bacterium]